MQALGEKVWQAVEVGWIKPKEAPMDWDKGTIKAANFNSRALNALFCRVTNKEFKKISSMEVAKEAWTILDDRPKNVLTPLENYLNNCPS